MHNTKMAISLLLELVIFIILLSPTITKPNAAQTKCLEHEKILLLKLKGQLVFDSSYSTKLVRWNQTDDCCTWEGVGCDDEGHVTSLQLDNESISGGFNDSSSLFSLKYLEELDLTHNFLKESQIPTEFHKLPHLTSLILSNCYLRGYFPETIFHLPTLRILSLTDNPLLSGTLPQFPRNNSFSFTAISLAYTNFSGSLPDSISNLERLSILDLTHSKFSGPVPLTLSNLTDLRFLDLSHNFFTGAILFTLSNITRLGYVNLADNFFTGAIPFTLTNLTHLGYVDFSHNLFTGAIPFALSNFTGLVHADLADNFFTGAIPLMLSNLTRLSYVKFSHNLFSGSLSSNHFDGLSSVVTVDLSYNSLSGVIPISIFTLPSLQELYLHHNQFSGQVSEFPTVNISTRLYDLDLSSNRLETPIPNSFFKIQSLRQLYLSHNLFNDSFQLEKILSVPGLRYLDLSGNFLSLDATSVRSSSNISLVKQSRLNTLDLSNNKIIGKIPSWIWEIGDGSLTYLNLSCNMLEDLQKPYYIPASLSLAVLDLHSNQLRGELPPILKQASYVDCSNNFFDSSIPETGSFSSYMLVFLTVANNSLSGSFPTFICNCTYLQVLDLSVNNLSGSIPPCLFQNVEKLQVLNLERNNLSGRIRDNFSPNCSLRTLELSHNNLVGNIPLSLKNCTYLAVMNVGNNHIEDSFPCMLPSSLQVLVLRSNRFHGGITCHNKSWSNHQIIDIASNNFSGYLNSFNFSSWKGMMLDIDVKSERNNLGVVATIINRYYTDEVVLTIKGMELKLVKIWPEFTSIDFSSNNFQGDIPEAIGELHSLHLLNLSHNTLGGTIPKSFGKLRQLESLDLSMNRLTGEIPQEIARLTFLVVMNVSHNELFGKIPTGSQIQTFSSDSFEGNMRLCGLPLDISCLNTPISPPTQGNEESGREIEWGYVFASAGYAVGLGSFCWVLLYCRSFRYKYFEKVDDFYDNIFYRHQHNKRRDRRRRRAIRNEVRRQ